MQNLQRIYWSSVRHAAFGLASESIADKELILKRVKTLTKQVRVDPEALTSILLPKVFLGLDTKLR